MINSSKSYKSYTRNEGHTGRFSAYTVLRPCRVVGSSQSNLRDARKLDEGSLNGLLANNILRALPPEEFANFVQDLEPATLIAGSDLYRLDKKMNTFTSLKRRLSLIFIYSRMEA